MKDLVGGYWSIIQAIRRIPKASKFSGVNGKSTQLAHEDTLPARSSPPPKMYSEYLRSETSTLPGRSKGSPASGRVANSRNQTSQPGHTSNPRLDNPRPPSGLSHPLDPEHFPTSAPNRNPALLSMTLPPFLSRTRRTSFRRPIRELPLLGPPRRATAFQ